MTSTAQSISHRHGVLIGAAVFLAVMALVWGVFHIAQSQRAFETSRWQERLAKTGADAVDKTAGWAAATHAALRAVAGNPTVQLYLAETGTGTGPLSQTAAAQQAFLASYIASLGQRGVFASSQPGGGGVAIINAAHDVVASTPGYRPAASQISTLTGALSDGAAGPIIADEDGKTAMFMAVIAPLQAPSDAAPVGYVIASRGLPIAAFAGGGPLAGDTGYQTLLSVVASGAPRMLFSTLGTSDDATISAGEVQAAANPGELVEGPGHDGVQGLHVGLTIPGTSWVLIQSVPRDVALAGVDQRIRSLIFMLLLALLAIIAGVIALWRHNASVVARHQAETARAYADEISAREQVLRAVADAHPGALILLDQGGKVRFVNAHFAGERGADAAQLVGATFAGIVPERWLPAAERAISEARQSNRAVTGNAIHTGPGVWHLLSAVPLSRADNVTVDGDVLVVVDDVSRDVEAREKQAVIRRAIMEVLLQAIDQRDPGAGEHSRRVARLARDAALSLGANAEECETVELAGALFNVGKLFVPAAILTKSGALTADERAQFEAGTERWLDLMGTIPLDLPLVRTSRAAHELMRRGAAPGAGPVGRDAAIVVAANILVALTSPRAYRDAMNGDDAAAHLSALGLAIPQSVVAALQEARSREVQARQEYA